MKRRTYSKGCKKNSFFRATAFCIAALFVFLSFVSAPVSAESQDELDTAIREAVTYLNGRIPKGSKAVFLNIKSDYPKLSEYILNDLATYAVNDGVFTVISRKNIDAVRLQVNFRDSGEVSDSSAQMIGTIMGAQTIVSGAVSKIGSSYRLEIRAIEAKNAAIQGQWNRNIHGSSSTMAALTGIPAIPAPEAAKTPAPAPEAAPAPVPAAAPVVAEAAPVKTETSEKTYKVGDVGPAGGFIFYDKGNNSGGWRYLEAAPSDIDKKLNAASESMNTSDTADRAVGKGKTNTSAIMKQASAKGGGFGWAAQACDAYVLNGFDDWFLPSRDELNYMYGNLHMQGIGDFRSEWYWSSTASNSSTANRSFYCESFDTGRQTTDYDENLRVRPARQF